VLVTSLSSVIRGSFWLYVGGLFSSFLGYLYWFVASAFVSPSVVGLAAAVISLQSVLIGVFSFGLPTGIQRFIGLSKGENDYRRLYTYFFTSLFFTVFVNSVLALSIVVLSFAGLGLFNLSSFDLSFVSILIVLGGWPSLFVSLFNSTLRTELTALSQALSSILRLIVGVLLLYIGLDFVGVMLGFMVASISVDGFLLFYGIKLFRSFKVKVSLKFSSLKDALKAGMASWFPDVLMILGQSLGVLSIYGFIGGSETGLYYIAFAIASIVYILPGSVLGLMFPVLSGMRDGRKRAISRAVQFSLAITVPLALVLALYSSVPLSLLGKRYVEASTMLSILALGALISPIVSGYGSYIYAIGKYSHVILLGLTGNLSRIVLYILLIPLFEAKGVALAYSLGFLLSLVAMVFSAYKTGYILSWMQYAKIISIPSLFAIVIYFSNLYWLIGLPLLLFLSFFAYTRLRIVSRADLMELSQAFMSEEQISKMYVHAKPIIKFIFGD